MKRIPRALVGAATRHPLWMLASVGMLIAASLPGFWRLELATDARALVPENAPEIVHDREIRGSFGVRDPLVVVLRTERSDGVFEPTVLEVIDDLTRDLEGIPGAHAANLQSLSTENGFHVLPGTFRFRTLLDPLPRTRERALELADDISRIGIYDGILVSEDGASAAILVGVPEKGDAGSGGVDRWTFYRRASALIEAHQAKISAAGARLSIVGPPVAESRLGRQVLHDLGLTPWRPAGELGAPSFGVGLVPLALVLMLGVLWVAFGRLAAALLPLAEVGLCLIVVFGLMGWLGIPIYITSTVLPVILTAVGVADEIHIFHRFRQLQAEQPERDRGDLIRTALEDMIPPVVKTSITTSIGFLSFALSPLPPVRLFGLFAAFGVLCCLALSLTFVPACLMLQAPERWARRSPSFSGSAAEAHRGPLLLVHLGRFVWQRRLGLLVIMGSIALSAGPFLGRVVVQDSWIDAFDPKSELSRAMHHFDEQFHGSHQLLVSLDFEAPRLAGRLGSHRVEARELRLSPSLLAELREPRSGALDPARLEGAWIRLARDEGENRPARQWSSWIDGARVEHGSGDWILELPRRTGSPAFWLQPEDGESWSFEIRSEPLMVPKNLHYVRELEATLRALPGVGGVLGPATYLETTAFMLRPDDPEARRLPERPDQARTLWSHFGRVRGQERLSLVVDRESYDRGLVTLFLEGSNYRETSKVIDAIREHEARHPEGPRLGLAGDVLVSQVLIEGVVDSQLRSLALSLLGIFVAASLLGGSWLWGVACVLPPAWAVLLDFAVMGAAGIPLGVATSMFAGMSLGVGVDYAIHLFERLERERIARGLGRASLVRALGTAAPAIVVDALAVGVGFSVLITSTVPGNARLGLLLVLAVVGCLFASLLLVPAVWACLRTREESARAQSLTDPATTELPASPAEPGESLA